MPDSDDKSVSIGGIHGEINGGLKACTRRAVLCGLNPRIVPMRGRTVCALVPVTLLVLLFLSAGLAVYRS